MANKKGEGVRGVLGDLVSRDQERKERPAEPTQSAPAIPAQVERQSDPSETPREGTNTPKKVGGIKGRPRAKKEEAIASKGEKTKVTLSIEETLRDQFYRLAYAEMIQPGEYVERAVRYYIETHRK